MKRLISLPIAMLFSLLVSGQPKYEFRAVWIATVDNIDWPSRGNYNTALQKEEFISQLNMHQRNGMNAIVMQVRPACDAFFPSDYEPWSEWLTGKQGKAPVPFYDPLEFMINETHKRGMEFHAWCNPYRAVFRANRSSIASNHVSRVHPDWVITYGDTKYLDPGNKQVQLYVVSVIRDMLRRYDIDAIHFDDYFYPYRIAGKEFPDNASYAKYGAGMDRETWRRSNVDSVILMLSRAIHEEKKTCKFGVSPFGVWRNLSQDSLGSNTNAGQTNYDDLYADILLWLKKGWIDYVVPQLYWEFEQKNAPFGVLLDWWSKHSYGRPCYIGLGYYRAGSNIYWRDKSQLPRQLTAIRNTPDIGGEVYFSSTSFQRNPYGWNDTLREHFYNYPALIAPMPWIDSVKPSPPVLKIADTRDSLIFYFESGKPADTLRGFAVYKTMGNFPMDSTGSIHLDSERVFLFIPNGNEPKLVFTVASLLQHKNERYFVTAISKTNNESEPIPLYPVTVSAP
ncbi:MAG: family 10 glycosylhydrolase [Bacteroidota bacterium]|nr:family 10 glycosylhydrolase [Bacteroidota bacterium]MDP4248859.1 family 10 glycosylhydrolase [Bacteroidota bacterium]